jgi:hypothetical protein
MVLLALFHTDWETTLAREDRKGKIHEYLIFIDGEDYFFFFHEKKNPIMLADTIENILEAPGRGILSEIVRIGCVAF